MRWHGQRLFIFRYFLYFRHFFASCFVLEQLWRRFLYFSFSSYRGWLVAVAHEAWNMHMIKQAFARSRLLGMRTESCNMTWRRFCLWTIADAFRGFGSHKILCLYIYYAGESSKSIGQEWLFGFGVKSGKPSSSSTVPPCTLTARLNAPGRRG